MTGNTITALLETVYSKEKVGSR